MGDPHLLTCRSGAGMAWAKQKLLDLVIQNKWRVNDWEIRRTYKILVVWLKGLVDISGVKQWESMTVVTAEPLTQPPQVTYWIFLLYLLVSAALNSNKQLWCLPKGKGRERMGPQPFCPLFYTMLFIILRISPIIHNIGCSQKVTHFKISDITKRSALGHEHWK